MHLLSVQERLHYFKEETLGRVQACAAGLSKLLRSLAKELNFKAQKRRVKRLAFFNRYGTYTF